VKVEFSDHALERARQRLSHMGLRAIAREIDDAIFEGRISREPPNWMVGPPHREGAEFCWSPSRQRVYVLAHRSSGYVVLVTVLRGVRVAA
jgi:hypothetical protein